MLNCKKNFVVVVVVVVIHFNTLGEEGRGFFNPMYFLFTVRWAYKRGSLLATVYNFRQAPVVYIFYAIGKMRLY